LGLNVNIARKTAMLLSGLCAVPIIFAPYVHQLWPVVILVGIAIAGHQGYSTNLYTLCSDMFPKRMVASVAGLGGFCGYMGATGFQFATGWWVQNTKNYQGPFLCAGLAYIVSLAIMHSISSDFKPAVLPEDTPGFPVILDADEDPYAQTIAK
jgi:ACS family hexuronate transporter-like MFS transporter